MEDRILLGPEMLQDMEQQVKRIREHLVTAQDRQKSMQICIGLNISLWLGTNFFLGSGPEKAQLDMVKVPNYLHVLWDHLKFWNVLV